MNDFNNTINDSKPTLVDFFATWCGPCRAQAPILEQLKLKTNGNANILAVDIDKNLELAQRYRVQSIPTLILFKDGEPVWRTVGVQQLSVLENKLNEFQW